MSAESIQARVTGRVQAVGFRYATHRTAVAAGVAGWVRNLPDGAVEVRAQGDAAAVAALVEFLHRGPRLAEVTAVETREVAHDPALRHFEIC